MNSPPFRPWLEGLEQRHLLTTNPNLQFLLNSVNQYTVSADTADKGKPIIPLYTDYKAGGTYGQIDAPTGSGSVSLDPDNPSAARGASSLLMSWNGSGSNGYFQFSIATPDVPQAHRIRDIPGMTASAVRFLARGDVARRMLEVNIFQVNGNSYQQILSHWFTLTTGWRDQVLKLPAPLAPTDLWAVQFLMDSQHDAGGGSVWLDDVRLDTSSADPYQAVQSYQALWAPTTSSPNTPPDRDLNVYPYYSFLYDNALTIIALTASRQKTALQAAENVADGILATGGNGDGSWFNQLTTGHILQGDCTARTPISPTRTLGDNAWFGLALLDLYQATNNTSYLNAAIGITNWAENNLKDTTDAQYQGYFGGYNSAGTLVGYRATEPNIDLFQLNRRLEALGDANAPVYAARASYAATFVLGMFDPNQGKFWTGTTSGDTINTSSVPLDVQLWVFLALAQWPEYAGNSTDMAEFQNALRWAENNLRTTDGRFTGFTFSSSSTGAAPGSQPPVWFEGNAYAVLEYHLLGETASAQAERKLLSTARLHGPHADPHGRGQIAASSDGLQDPDLGAIYDARLAVAASAWTYLATQNRNPFAALPANG